MDAHRQLLDMAEARLKPLGLAVEFDKVREQLNWTPSEASRKRREKALASVDGLSAGLRYLDVVEPILDNTCPTSSVLSSVANRFIPDLPVRGVSQEDYLKELDLDHCDQGSADNRQPPLAGPEAGTNGKNVVNESQLEALRTFRADIEGQQRKIRDIHYPAGESASETIAGLQGKFKNGTILREAGLKVYRNVLHDRKSPTGLAHVLAFTCLSYVIAMYLYKKGRIKSEAILCGIYEWREAISSAEEKKAFDLLAKRLWPEAKVHLSPKIGRNPGRSTAMVCGNNTLFGNASCDTAISDGNPMDVLRVPGLPQSATAILDDLGDAYRALWFGEASEQLMGSLDDYIHIHHFNDMGLDASQRSIAHEWQQNSAEIPTSQFEPPLPRPEPDILAASQEVTAGPSTTSISLASKLRATLMFMAMYVWIEELSPLLFKLSGQGVTVQDPDGGEALSEPEKSDLKDFFTLRTKGECPSRYFHALLRMAEEFSNDGLLRSTTQVQNYLIHVANVRVCCDEGSA
jgi:hypothetical protein